MPPKGIVLPLDDRPTQRFSGLSPDTANDSRSRVSLPQRHAVNSLIAEAFCPNIQRAAESLSFDFRRRPPALAPGLPLHLRGLGTTRTELNQTLTAKHGGLPPGCPKPQEDA